MSDVSWDDDDFEPKKAAPVLPSDKWDGEDEDEVKQCCETWDNWDDEDEEKSPSTTTTTDTTTTTTIAPVKKKKKKLGDIIAEKEARQQEEVERRRREIEERAASETAEGRLAEKLRLQKVQEDADLQLASELMGDEGAATEDDSRILEGVDLSTAEGLTSLRLALVNKIRSTDRLEKRPAFVNFVEDLARDLCQNLETDEVKRVTAVLNTLYNEKTRANKPKSKKKQAGKAKLNVGSGAIVDDYTTGEYDDFI